MCKNKLEEIWEIQGEDTINCIDFTASGKGIWAGGDQFAVGT